MRCRRLLLLRLQTGKPSVISPHINTIYHHSSLVLSRNDISRNREISQSNWTITTLGRDFKIADARRIFDGMENRDVVSWTAMVTVYVRSGRIQDARRLLDHPGSIKNVVTWTAVLSGYIRVRRIKDAEDLFRIMPEKNVVSWNTMICGYANNGMVDDALRLFERMPVRNIVSWNTIVSALAQSGRISKAMEIFQQMDDRDVISWTAIVAGLSQNGRIDEARLLFDEMPKRNIVSWNAMISGYAQNCRVDEAFLLFDKMPERDVASWNTMITGFIQNSDLPKARALFQRMNERNVVTWTTLLTGYAQDGQGEEALRIFSSMQNGNITPNQGTFVSLLSAVGSLAGLGEGKQIHQIISKTAFQFSPFVQSALISMYAKCGEIEMARRMFDASEHSDVVTWNSMVASFAHHGRGNDAVLMFETMLNEGIKPDGASYVGVLSGCSHAGLVDKGLKLFAALLDDGSVEVREDHYACLVDLYGRAGRMEEVVTFINGRKRMRSSPAVWGALLAGCNLHGNVEIANLAAEKLMKIEPENAGTYMLLSNTYASTGRWKEAAAVRSKMKDFGLKKQPGCSWIEVGNVVHVFVVRDRCHEHLEIIQTLVQNLHFEMKKTRKLMELSVDELA